MAGGGCRSWGLLVVPYLFWRCLPPWEDVGMLCAFLLSQVLFYSMQHVKGAFVMSTLVLILWCKSFFAKWYQQQMLTKEFFVNLLWLGFSATAAFAAVVLVWMPLHDAYACVVSRLDKATAHTAMAWRDEVFLVLAIALAISAFINTDLVLKSKQVDDTGLNLMMKKLSSKFKSFFRCTFRMMPHMFRGIRRQMRSVCKECLSETKTMMCMYSKRPGGCSGQRCRGHSPPHPATGGDDQADAAAKTLRFSASSAPETCTRRTRSWQRRAHDQEEQPQCSYTYSNTQRLRSADRKSPPPTTPKGRARNGVLQAVDSLDIIRRNAPCARNRNASAADDVTASGMSQQQSGSPATVANLRRQRRATCVKNAKDGPQSAGSLSPQDGAEPSGGWSPWSFFSRASRSEEGGESASSSSQETVFESMSALLKRCTKPTRTVTAGCERKPRAAGARQQDQPQPSTSTKDSEAGSVSHLLHGCVTRSRRAESSCSASTSANSSVRSAASGTRSSSSTSSSLSDALSRSSSQSSQQSHQGGSGGGRHGYGLRTTRKSR